MADYSYCVVDCEAGLQSLVDACEKDCSATLAHISYMTHLHHVTAECMLCATCTSVIVVAASASGIAE
jgi:hypothetical protein